jgi:hypothetical protein
MRLKRALSEAFSGGRAAPRTNAAAIGPVLDQLKQLAGSRRAAARAAGVPESSYRRWEKGARPKNAAGVTRALTTAVRTAMRKDPPAGGKVTVRIANPGKGPRTRSVAVDPGAIERAGEAWARGDLGGMVRAFRAGITDDWYRKELFKPDANDETTDDDDLSYEGYDDADEDVSAPQVGGVGW